MESYPDNIGTDTSDPRSPLYIAPPECDECGGDLLSSCDEEGFLINFYCEDCDE